MKTFPSQTNAKQTLLLQISALSIHCIVWIGARHQIRYFSILSIITFFFSFFTAIWNTLQPSFHFATIVEPQTTYREGALCNFPSRSTFYKRKQAKSSCNHMQKMRSWRRHVLFLYQLLSTLKIGLSVSHSKEKGYIAHTFFPSWAEKQLQVLLLDLTAVAQHQFFCVTCSLPWTLQLWRVPVWNIFMKPVSPCYLTNRKRWETFWHIYVTIAQLTFFKDSSGEHTVLAHKTHW